MLSRQHEQLLPAVELLLAFTAAVNGAGQSRTRRQKTHTFIGR
jgi:hypothetical protein